MAHNNNPNRGPFLFETSAESWLNRHATLPPVHEWMRAYASQHQIHVSAVTVLERTRGYSLLGQRDRLQAYLKSLERVWALDAGIAALAGELLAVLPDPPTPPKRTHLMAESKSSRLARWRFDVMIGATAMVKRLPLLHNNAADFEPLRSLVELSPGRFSGASALELIRVSRLLET